MENLGNRDKMVTIHQFMCYTNSRTFVRYAINQNKWLQTALPSR